MISKTKLAKEIQKVMKSDRKKALTRLKRNVKKRKGKYTTASDMELMFDY